MVSICDECGNDTVEYYHRFDFDCRLCKNCYDSNDFDHDEFGEKDMFRPLSEVS
ncbi:hypothetical protein LCGC14_0586290 [marine sediment metagenome]|uniref:Uncharacterized protein n=1 Tax=marine sediment metagenome TaxID=412755 RepID=A0A0F9UN43_9ZZZZ